MWKQNGKPINLKLSIMQIKFSQTDKDDCITVLPDLSFEIQGEIETLQGLKDMAGSVLNHVFKIQKLYAKAGSQAVKSSRPLMFEITTDKGVFDTYQLSQTLTQKFKFNRTAKSKRAFFNRLMVAIEVAHLEFTALTEAELNAAFIEGAEKEQFVKDTLNGLKMQKLIEA